MKFEIKGKEFYRDGRPIKLISGAVHYFRNMPDTWTDIFKKMRALGCNCVETYCAWNAHEKRPGEFCFGGNLDIARFIRAAEAEGLMAIVRPGPYICAEWEFGGLPWWIQTCGDMEIRCSDPTYIKHFENYLVHLFDEIRPLLSTNGGPIIMMQCENEYGYYGDDKSYLRYLYRCYRRLGIDVPLFTSDGTSKDNLLDGGIDGCIATLNFGSRVKESFRVHDELFPDMPKMCMEMWDGWFDAWGDEKHHTTSAEEYAKTVGEMLERGSVNVYMMIGGTNYGFMNGANHYEKYAPTVTSYDYDAVLSECGDVTPKYFALRELFRKYTKEELPPVPENRKKKGYGKVRLTEYAGILDNLDCYAAPIFSNVPKPMESYGQGYGYIAYRTVLHRDYEDAELSFADVGDRAQVYVNRELAGIVYTNDEELKVTITAKAGDVLTVLCENMGRVNFGSKMMRKKGIVGRCLLGGKIHFNWDVYLLPMEALERIEFTDKEPTEPSCFYRGYWNAEECADTFLYLENFTKGIAFVNGFNLGRYWEIGPQRTLYVPASLLKKGKNEIVIFESDGRKGETVAELLDRPILG